MLKILNKLKKSKNLSEDDQRRRSMIRKNVKATTQNTICYTSLFENGLMHIAKEEWSRTYKLGDVAYISATQEEKIDVIETHAEALNSLDSGTTFQLLVINRKIEDNIVDKIKYTEVGDGFDNFRREYNELIEERFSTDSN